MGKIIGNGVRQQTKGLSDRTETLELAVVQLRQKDQDIEGNLHQRLDTQNETLEALVEFCGIEEISRIVNQRRIDKARAEAAAEEASLKQGVEAGYVVPATAVEDKSLIVGKFTRPDGTVEEPGRHQYLFALLHPDFKTLLLGKVVGDKFDLPNGGSSFELLEIYSIDVVKQKAWQKAMRDAASAAAKKASEASAGDPTAEAQADAIEAAAKAGE